MLNYWWVTRPKRKLNSVPDILSVISHNALNEEWEGERDSHLMMESALETGGIKKIGDRRDQTGGGGRTYIAWLKSLGLLFTQESNKKLRLTLAGEALLNGVSPVKILTNQVLKYQFPSSYSIGRGIQVNQRFKIHPFWFLLKLLADTRVLYLTKEEIAKIIITEAENESDKCYEYIVERIHQFRNYGDKILNPDFAKIYKSSKGKPNYEEPYTHLLDIANTIVNWLDYTQLIGRSEGKISILEERYNDVATIVANPLPFIHRPDQHENYQRKYGLDLKHKKDTRDLNKAAIITVKMLDEARVKSAFIEISLKKPIGILSDEVIETIAEKTGINVGFVEEVLQKNYPHGAIGGFMSNYFEMAFKGTEQCRELEKATAEIFRDIFGFNSKHIAGGAKEVPDVLLFTNEAGYQAIIDTKAYKEYGLPATHRDRMVYHYIPNISDYSEWDCPLKFFSYIAGGFTDTIANQLSQIVNNTGIHGSAMPISNFIKMVERHNTKPYSHEEVANIFTLDRKISITDIYNQE